MTDVRKLIADLRRDPQFAEALAVVDLVRNVGEKLERMRLRAGLTQAQLASQLGISAGRISQLESGLLRHAPSLKMLAQFAKACGETIDVVPSGERQGDEHRVASSASTARSAVADY